MGYLLLGQTERGTRVALAQVAERAWCRSTGRERKRRVTSSARSIDRRRRGAAGGGQGDTRVAAL